MQGSLYKCLTKWIIAVSHSDSTWVTAVLKLSMFRSLGRVQTFMTQQDWQYGSRVVAWGQKGIFFIFILLLRGKYLLLLAVNTPSKNSLEFGRRAGWTLAKARSRGDSEWGSLQTALPGLGRGNSVMSGSQWLGLASGHKSIYRLRLSHGASMQQETKRASYFLTRARIKQSTTVILIVALYKCTKLRFERGLTGLEACASLRRGEKKFRNGGKSISQLFTVKSPLLLSRHWACTPVLERWTNGWTMDIPGLAAVQNSMVADFTELPIAKSVQFSASGNFTPNTKTAPASSK